MIRLVKYSLIVLICFTIYGCNTVQHLASIDNTNIQLDDKNDVVNHPLEAMISDYRIDLDSEMNEVIGVCATDLVKGKVNSSMGNFVSDLLYSEAVDQTGLNVDFALQNYGGLRLNSLPKGEVTRGKIFELMPFDNLLVIVAMDADQVLSLCNRIADYGGWPLSEGITLEIQNGEANNIKIKGQHLDTNRTYQVAMPDYIANGGDTCPFMIGLPQTDTGIYIRHILISGIEAITAQGKLIEHNPSIRITK